MKTNLYLSIMAIFVTLTLLLIPINASAYEDVYVCAITLLGYKYSDGGTVVLKLDDQSDTVWVGERAFYLHPDLGKTGYATLLTAYSLGKTVRVRIEGTAEPGSLITHLYINP